MDRQYSQNGWRNNGWLTKRKHDLTRCACDYPQCQAHKGTWCKLDGEIWVTHRTKDHGSYWNYPTVVCQFCLPLWLKKGFTRCVSGLLPVGETPTLAPQIECSENNTKVAEITPQCITNDTLSSGTIIDESTKSTTSVKIVSGTRSAK